MYVRYASGLASRQRWLGDLLGDDRTVLGDVLGDGTGLLGDAATVLGDGVGLGRQLCLEPTRAIFAPQSGHSDILWLYVEHLAELALDHVGLGTG